MLRRTSAFPTVSYKVPRAALFLAVVLAMMVADMLARRPALAWYWHVAGIAYVGIATLLMQRRGHAPE